MKNIIQIADHRVTIKHNGTYRATEDCKHLNTIMEENGQFVKCEDCNSNLSPYWVLKAMLEGFEKARKDLKREKFLFHQEQAVNLTSTAAKTAQAAWRLRSMVPSCPHCHRGILPTDGFGNNKTNKEMELRRREIEKQRRESEMKAQE